MAQFFIKAVVKKLVRRHQDNDMSTLAQQFITIADRQFMIFDVLHHVERDDGVEFTDKIGIHFFKIRLYEIYFLNATEVWIASKFLLQDLAIVCPQIGKRRVYFIVEEESRDITNATADLHQFAFYIGRDGIIHPFIEIMCTGQRFKGLFAYRVGAIIVS